MPLGTYHEALYVSHPLVLNGVSQSFGKPILDGAGDQTIITVYGNADLTIDNFVLQNGNGGTTGVGQYTLLRDG